MLNEIKKSEKSKKNLDQVKIKKDKVKKSTVSQLNLPNLNYEPIPTKIRNKKKSTNIINELQYIDAYMENQDTDDSLYLPNFCQNFEGKFFI